jgi:hypothetical protein
MRALSSHFMVPSAPGMAEPAPAQAGPVPEEENMRRLALLAAAALSCAAIASTAFAYPERVEEVWRSPYGSDRASPFDHPFAPSPFDRSFWMIDGATVVHYANDGTLLSRSQALCAPWVLGTDPADGSCWVLQGNKDELLHFGADGVLLSATPGPSHNATLLSSPADGSVWVSDSDRVMHVDASGAVVWTRWAQARALAADPADGSVWMLEDGVIARRASNGSELWHAAGFGAEVRLGEDPRNQSVWIGDETGMLTHFSATGQVLSQTSNPSRAVLDVQVLPSDGSLWAYYSWDLDNPTSYDPAGWCYVVHLDASGAELLRYVSSQLWFTNLRDGCAWISGSGRMSLLSATGELMHEMEPNLPFFAFDPVDSGYWTTGDWDEPPQLSRYQADGVLLWTQLRVEAGWRLWVDPSDGSCWMNESRQFVGSTLVHVSPEGEELERRPLPAPQIPGTTVSPVGFSATDHTWWVRDCSALVHLAEDGTVLWRHDNAFCGVLVGFEISPLDGSLWLASSEFGGNPETHDTYPPCAYVLHLSPDGTVLGEAGYALHFLGCALAADGGFWAVFYDAGGTTKLQRFSPTGEPVAEVPFPAGFYGTGALQVDLSDGSVYVVGLSLDYLAYPGETVFRMAADGTLLWQLDGFYWVSIALVPNDGSLWIADQGYWRGDGTDYSSPYSQVAHLDANGQYLWRGDMFDRPSQLHVNSYDGTVWLHDLGDRQIVHLRATMPPFPDIAADSWAFDAIAACAAAGIVQGYWDGTYRPDLPVTRGQMAVYISRALAGGDEGVQVPSGTAEPTFTDVGADHWAYRYVEYCAGANVVEGYPDGGYHPGEVVNRGQMAVYIARALVTPSGDAGIPDYAHMVIEPPVFVLDVTPYNEWAWCYNHVVYCVVQGVVQGYPDAGSGDAIRYVPGNAVTRDQMAVYIARAFALPL